MSGNRTEVLILRGYALAATALLAVFTWGAVKSRGKASFDEIDVQRINVIEPDGKYRLVISNKERSIGPIAYMKPFGYPGGTRPGLIFFNDEGTENGGLTFSGRTVDGKFEAGGHLSFDQYNQDQVLYLTYSDANGRRRMGFTVADRADVLITDLVARFDSVRAIPEGPARDSAARALQTSRYHGAPLMAERVYVGRNLEKTALLRLSDGEGRPRILLQVDSLGQVRLRFLDAEGRTTAVYPGT
ncbi:MAG: hypothetical protein R2882_04080 [Gemmatimonadales bacterium]